MKTVDTEGNRTQYTETAKNKKDQVMEYDDEEESEDESFN